MKSEKRKRMLEEKAARKKAALQEKLETGTSKYSRKRAYCHANGVFAIHVKEKPWK